MDKAHLSRIVARFLLRGLVVSRISPEHRKHRLLSLTPAGRDVFAAAEAAARAQVDALMKPIDTGARERLVEAMRDIRETLSGHGAEEDLALRRLRPGDAGWIIHRQTVLYAQEYGWDWTYEGLASRILGAFIAEFDPDREDGWVAELRGAIAGSIFLMKCWSRRAASTRRPGSASFARSRTGPLAAISSARPGRWTLAD